MGEKGFMLSGGQKARICLARVIYRDADIYLLDDPLSALDKKVANQIMERCMYNFLKGKTVILVSHQVQFLEKLEHTYALINGKTYKVDKKSLFHMRADESSLDDSCINNEKQLVDEEECKDGMSSWKVYKDYFTSGSFAIFFLSLFLFGLMFSMKLYVDKVAKDFASNSWSNENMIRVILLICMIFLLDLGRQILYYINICLCSINLHRNMFKKIMSVGMRFFNIYPKGRILNRFSRDLGQVDSFLYFNLEIIILFPGGMLFSFALAAFKVPYLVIPFLLLFLSLYFTTVKITHYASKLKRLDSITASPIYESLDSTLSGITTIRCFERENQLMNQFYNVNDRNIHYFFLLQAFNLFSSKICFLWIFITQLITNFSITYFATPATAFINALAMIYIINFVTGLVIGLKTFTIVDGIVRKKTYNNKKIIFFSFIFFFASDDIGRSN